MTEKNVNVFFGANIDGLLAGVKESTAAIEGFSEQVQGLTSVFTGFGEAVMAAFGVEQVASFSEKIIELGVDIGRMQAQLGGSALNVQALTLAADKSDLQISLLTRSMTQFSLKAEDAIKGTGRTASAFEALGINAKNYLETGHTVEQLFELTTERLSAMNDSLNKSAIVAALFGGRSSQLVSVLNDLGENSRKFNEEVEAVGGGIMFTFVPAAEESSEKLALMKIAAEDAKGALFMSLKPAIDKTIESITDLNSSFTHSVMADGTVQRVIDGIVGAFLLLESAIMNVILLFNQLWTVVTTVFGDLIAGAAGLGTVLNDLFHRNWNQAAIDAKAYTSAITGSWDEAGKKMSAATDESLTKQRKMWADYFNDIKTRAKDATIYGPPVPKPQEGAGAKTDAPLLGDPDKMQTQIQIWEAALNKMLLDKQLFGAQATQEELHYWQNILATAKMGAQERSEIEKKIYDLEKQERSEDLAEHKSALQEQLSELDQNYDSRRALIQQYYNWLKAKYPDDTQALNEALKMQNRNTAEAMRANEREYMKFFEGFNRGIEGMLTRTETWRQFMARAVMNVFDTWLKSIEQILAKWLAKEAAQTTATVAGDGARTAADVSAAKASSAAFGASGKATIMGDAAKAYGGVYGFLAPEIGPFAAIPAGIAFAAVAGMESLIPSFEVGSWKTSAGLAMIHDDEMIIPAGPAGAIRDGAGGGGGDTMHVTIQTIDSAGFKSFIMQNSSAIAQAVKKESGNFNSDVPGWRK